MKWVSNLEPLPSPPKSVNGLVNFDDVVLVLETGGKQDQLLI